MANKYLSILFVFSFIIFSCKKDVPSCHGNCAPILINGKAYLVPSLTPLSNILVEANFYVNRYCIGCTFYSVGTEKTKNDGTFSIQRTIDTSFFNDYHLNVRIPPDSNYIILPYEGVHVWFDNFSPPAYRDLNFEYYRKTTVLIRLHRTQSDAFAYTFVYNQYESPAFGEQPGSGYVSISGQRPIDTSFTFSTPADVFTKIVVEKKLTPNGPFIKQIDSLKCISNYPNTIDIYY
jgi:hypothetical protein